MYLIDTHVHLYEKEYAPDLDAVLERAVTNGVRKMIMPNVDSGSIASMQEIALQNAGSCFSMIGLHPCYVKEDVKLQLEKVKQELEVGNYVGVGEIGLDLYWDKTYLSEQMEAFLCQVRWAIEHQLPIAIHSRDATRNAIDALKPYVSHSLRGVFHCFGGTLEEAKEILEMGFYLGIGGVVTFKNGGLDKLLPHIPLDCLVLETDGPYLAPVPFRGKRNESGYLNLIARKVAEIYQVPFEKVAQKTSANAEKLFSI